MDREEQLAKEYANSNFENVAYHYTDDKRLTDFDKVKKSFKAVNTGNGFKITQEYKGKLNYSESFLLYIILRLEYKDYNIKIGEFKEL